MSLCDWLTQTQALNIQNPLSLPKCVWRLFYWIITNVHWLYTIVIPPAHTIYVTLQSTRERASLLQNCIIMYLHMIRQNNDTNNTNNNSKLLNGHSNRQRGGWWQCRLGDWTGRDWSRDIDKQVSKQPMWVMVLANPLNDHNNRIIIYSQ